MNFLILLGILISIYYYTVFNYFIGGDDVSNILNAPSSIQTLLHFFTNLSQYRPIPFSFFTIYKILPFNLPLFHSITISLLLTAIFFYNLFLQKILHLNKLTSFTLAFCYSVSHIIFLLVFTISGIGDLIFINFFWLTLFFAYQYLQNKNNRNLILSLLFFLCSILSKEIFLITPVLITLYIFIFPSGINKKTKTKTLISFWLPTIIFYSLKVTLYRPLDSSYTYLLDPKILSANLINFALWLLNFKHGWQMGMALPPGSFYYSITFLYALFFLTAILIAIFKKTKLAIFLLLWIFASLIPFYFLSRTLVYYLDIALFPFLAFAGLFIKNIYDKNKKYGLSLLAFFLVISIYLSQTILKQWLNFSFVAASVQTSENFYSEVVLPYDWESKYSVLCVLNMNSDSSWATAQANEINLFTNRKIQTSTTQSLCQKTPQKSLIFINTGRNFIKK